MTRFQRIKATDATHIKYAEVKSMTGIDYPRQSTANNVVERFEKSLRGETIDEGVERETWPIWRNEANGSRSGTVRKFWSAMKKLMRGYR